MAPLKESRDGAMTTEEGRAFGYSSWIVGVAIVIFDSCYSEVSVLMVSPGLSQYWCHVQFAGDCYKAVCYLVHHR